MLENAVLRPQQVIGASSPHPESGACLWGEAGPLIRVTPSQWQAALPNCLGNPVAPGPREGRPEQVGSPRRVGVEGVPFLQPRVGQ